VLRSFAAVLLVGSLGACHGSSVHRVSPPRPEVDVVLTDAGITFSRSRVPAGYYWISFEDHRTHSPSGQRVELDFGPDAPGIGFFKLPAGTRQHALLVGNFTAWYFIDGVRHRDGSPGFYVTTTKEYPTPAT
jgi:hypothetical protein